MNEKESFDEEDFDEDFDDEDFDDEDEDFDEDLDLEDDEDFDIEEEEEPEENASALPKTAKEPPVKEAAQKAAPSQQEPIETEKLTEKSVSAENIPLTLVVEIARLNMSIQKIMHLEPGNLLQLEASPDSEVSLVINNQKVGKGELIRFGDVLGVRVTEIGTSS